MIFVLGAGAGVSSTILYATSGFDKRVLVLWLVGLAITAASFRAHSMPLPRVARVDLVVSALLAAAFAPLYLVGVHSWPVQVNSDEVSIMTFAERHSSEEGVDLFGLSDYLGHPKVLFVLIGNLGGMLGGVDLQNTRLVHGALGLLAITASYGLFRQLLPRGWAALAVCVLGLNHSFLMLSRMAMRENTVVLVEVVALALLLRGVRHGHTFVSFAGGVVAGLGFYVYFPGRAIVLLWLLFLAGLALFFRESVPIRRLVRLGAVAAVGFVLTATPVVVAGLQAPSQINEQQRLALLVFPEGREIQKGWVFADSVTEGIKKNISHGLTAFNSDRSDNAWNYPNLGHGFVDPLTGVLLWIGVGAVLVQLVRRREEPWALLALGSFLALWLALAFVVNKAPNYPRLLVTIPFVAYFAAVAVRAVAEALRARLAEAKPAWASFAPAAFTAVAVAGVAAWNLSIAWDFVSLGRKTGDDIGTTGRYIESHSDTVGQRFYLAASEAHPYYAWGYPQIWQERMLIFSDDASQVGGVVSPSALRDFNASPPFVVFMNREVFSAHEHGLTSRYPQAGVREITSDGRLVVFEVPRFAPRDYPPMPAPR